MLLLSNWMIFEKEMDMSLRNYILLSFDVGVENRNTFIGIVDYLLISYPHCLRLPIYPRRYFRRNFPTYSRLTDIRLIT